uniref:hypothetical protein n=1 Tax=uncultured Caulobacter sp. TaxID=158749 RepID=UPI00345C1B0C
MLTALLGLAPVIIAMMTMLGMVFAEAPPKTVVIVRSDDVARALPRTFIFHRHRFQVFRRRRNQITALRISAPLDDEREL